MTKSTSNPSIAVIGCGAIAEMYHLPALVANPRTRHNIVLVDPNRERLEQMGQAFSASAIHENYLDVLDKVDGAIVATPPATHFAICKAFLEKNVHVLCEKPLTEDGEEARTLVDCARQNNVHLAVNQTRRFFPTYQAIRELIADGALGELRAIRYHDGVEFDWPAASPHHFKPTAKGAWSDTGVHLLDSVLFWIGARPTLVESLNDAQGGPEAISTVRLRHQNCDIEIKVSRLGRLHNSFRIEGTKGYIEAGAEDWTEVRLCLHDGRQQRVKPPTPTYNEYTDFAKPLLDDFVEVIAGQKTPFVSGESTIDTIELLEEAYDRAQNYAMPWNDHWKEMSHA